jgi:putative ABC transport system substrate-binding protein
MAYGEADPEGQGWIAAFRERLRQLGWVEESNVRIDYRWGAVDLEVAQQFAKELVTLRPDLILTQNTLTTASVLQQTQTIPILFVNISDPVGSGFVASFARPGGNITGFINLEPTIAGKWLELLREIAPNVSRVGFLFNPATAPYADYYLTPFKAAAASYALEALPAPVRDASELEAVFSTLARDANGGMVVMPRAFVNVHRDKITSLATRYRLPAIYPYRLFTERGGLLSYGTQRITTGAQRIMLIGFSTGQGQANCPSRYPSSSSLRSI